MPLALVSIMRGLADGPDRVAAAGLVGIYQPIGHEIAAPEELRLFAAAQRRLHETSDTIPVRFGSLFASPAAIAEHLSTNAGRYLAMLERYGSMVEYTVRVDLGQLPALRVSQPEDSSPARAYLSRRKASLLEADGIAPQLDHFARNDLLPLRAFSIDYRIEPATTRVPVAAVTFLLARSAEADFTDRYAALELTVPTTLTGPWPPATFAGSTELAKAA